MKRTPLKRIGKVVFSNLEANKKLIKLWKETGINYCEFGLKGCLGNWLLQNVHRHKRSAYRNCLEMLYNYNQVVRGCQACHDLIEHDKKLTEKMFLKLRGEDKL